MRAMWLSVFFSALSVYCLDITEDAVVVCGMSSVLRCQAKSKPDVKYRAVKWYKFNEDEDPSHRLSGLLMKDLSPNGTTKWYAGLERQVEILNNSLDIILPNVTAKDSGNYRCHLAAPIGQQNQEGQIYLRVVGCPNEESTDQSKYSDNMYLVVAILLLIASLLTFIISYACLKHTLMQRNKRNPQEQLLDKPLEKKDLMLIYTLGPNWSGQASMKQMSV